MPLRDLNVKASTEPTLADAIRMFWSFTLGKILAVTCVLLVAVLFVLPVVGLIVSNQDAHSVDCHAVAAITYFADVYGAPITVPADQKNDLQTVERYQARNERVAEQERNIEKFLHSRLSC